MEHDEKDVIATAEEPSFHHRPLNHEQPSIRLIKVLPNLSHDGLLECEMHFATVHAEYTCLSYVWGMDAAANPIKIDGKLFHVQNNLVAFLDVARRMYPSRPFWIDSLCIDQGEILERNHQVQQMGRIFSEAKRVIAWMGKRPLTAEVFKVALTHADRTDWLDRWWRLFPPGVDAVRALNDLFYNAYWTRAWITQEVLLPNNILAQANDTTIDLSFLAKTFVNRIKYPSTPTPFHTFKQLALDRKEIMGSSLMWLIHRFQDSQCSIERDRIFSLLSLCGDGGTLKVDYETPDESLMANVMGLSAASVCLCSVAVLARSLHYQDPGQSQDYWAAGPLNERFRNDPPIMTITLNSTELISNRDALRYLCSNCGSYVAQTFVTHDIRTFCLEQICPEICGHLYWDQTDVVYHQQTPPRNPEAKLGVTSFEPRKLCIAGKGVTILEAPQKEMFEITFTLQASIEIVRERVSDVNGKLGLCSNVPQHLSSQRKSQQ